MDKKLIKACKNNDRKAQRDMLDKLSPFLLGVCKRYGCNSSNVQDILQESLIKIFNNIHKFRSSEVLAFKAWCKRITINTLIDLESKNKKRTLAIEYVGGEQTVLPDAMAKMNVEDIILLLDQLPEQHRMVFNLSVIDGYSHKEISRMLAIEESSSRTFLVRARRMLQRLIEQEINFTSLAN